MVPHCAALSCNEAAIQVCVDSAAVALRSRMRGEGTGSAARC